MPEIELFVSLKVPDNVALTAFNALKRMGYDKLSRLERSDYYKFEISGDESKFRKEISNVDILINANKHKFSFSLEENKKIKDKKGDCNIINVMVQDLDNGSGLLRTLKERLGFQNIKRAEKGVLWKMCFDKDAEAKNLAEKMTKELLMNGNYQSFKFIS